MFYRRLIAVVLSVLLVILSGCSGDKSKDTSKDSEVIKAETEKDVFVAEPQAIVEIKEESFSIKAETLKAEFEQCSIEFSPFDIDSEKTLVISTVQATPYQEELDHDYKVNVYDFALSNEKEFIDLIEITLPYDDSYIDSDADESRTAFGMYFNESTSEWEPQIYTVDTENNTVTIITNHLSKYGVFTVKNQNTRLAFIANVMPYSNIVDSDAAKEIIQEAIVNPNDEIAKARDLAMNTTNDWLGLSSFLLTTSDPIYSSELMKGMGSTFNALGVAAAVYQLSIDMDKEPSPELYGNLSKNLLNISVSYWGSSALQPVFTQLKKRINWYLMDQYTQELNNVKNMYNQVINVTIEEIVAENAQPIYADHVIRFSPLAENVRKSSWTGKLSKEGKAFTKFTLLGYIQSGRPIKLDVYLPDADLDTARPIYSVDFTLDKDSLYIPIGELPVEAGANVLSDEKSIMMYNNMFNITTGFTLNSSHKFEIVVENSVEGSEITQYIIKLTEPTKKGEATVIGIDAYVENISHTNSDNISDIVIKEAAWKGTTESSDGSITVSFVDGDSSAQIVTYEVILDVVNSDGDASYGGGAILYYFRIDPYSE